MMNEEKETSISISEILRVFLRRWWIILIASIVGAAALLSYTYFFTTQYYTATVKMYVNSKDLNVGSTSISLSDLQTGRNLVDTYAIILTSRDTVDKVIDECNLEGKAYEYENISKYISVGAVNSTEIFYIQVKWTDPEIAEKIADEYIEVFPSEVKEIISGTSATKVESAKVQKVSRNFKRNTLIGFMVGFVISAGILFVFDLFIDDTIDNVDWVKNTLTDDIPLLTIIPNTEDEGKKGYGYHHHYYEYRHHHKKDGGTENKA